MQIPIEINKFPLNNEYRHAGGQSTTGQAVDAVLLLGAPQPSAEQEAQQRENLLPALAAFLKLSQEYCRLEFREDAALSVVTSWRTANRRCAVCMPLALEADDHFHEAIWGDLDWERVRHPEMSIHVGTILGVQPLLVAALAARVAAVPMLTNTAILAQETAILVVGRGGVDPEKNAEIARLARLLWEGRPYGWVEAAYQQQTQPSVESGLRRCLQLGTRQIIVAPYCLYQEAGLRRLATQVNAFQQARTSIPIGLAESLQNHPDVIEAIAQQVVATAFGQPLLRHRSHHRGDHHRASVLSYPAITSSILPPRYRNGVMVSAAPMAAAPLVYDAEGRVAWDQIWGAADPLTDSGQVPNSPFCELALAGGPPHRGELLGPATPEIVKADWAGYGRVLAELTRGIQMTTGLRTSLSQALGWIGVECHSPEMALWLLRAIVMENVSVRREGDVLYLPAGPTFRLEHEIKNVITALAKTHHYWQEHQRG